MSYGSVPQTFGSDLSELEYGEHGGLATRDGKVDVEGGNFRASKRVTGVIAILAVVIIGLFGYSSTLGGSSSISSSERSHRSGVDLIPNFAASSDFLKERRKVTENFKETEFNLKISVTNEYGEYKGAYSWLAPNLRNLLIEPYKEATFRLNMPSSEEKLDFYTTWESSKIDGVLKASEFKFTATDTEPFTVTANWHDSWDDEVLDKVSYTVYPKYVKRELRTLTEADKEKFLTAMNKVYREPRGTTKYGDSFLPNDALVEQHAAASNDIMCDTMHDGSGFYPHHMSLTMSFENSLRAVDPSVTLHYWDFTREGQAIYDAGADASYMEKVSTILTDEWFGNTDMTTHRIKDSKFANLDAPRTTDESRVAPNSYGYTRSYWNHNPDSKVSRAPFSFAGQGVITNKVMPTCNDHFTLLGSENLADFQVISPSIGHGPVHVFTGGIYGPIEEGMTKFLEKWGDSFLNAPLSATAQEYFEEKYPTTYGAKAGAMMSHFRDVILGEYFHFYRMLYRSHTCSSHFQMLQCDTQCEESDRGCTCSLAGLTQGQYTHDDVTQCIVKSTNTAYYVITKLWPKEMLHDFIDTVSNYPLYEGDMLESASPADPLFWVIHPTIERVLQLKLQDYSDAPKDFQRGNLGRTEFKPWDKSAWDWLDYSTYTFGVGENQAFPNDAYTCSGHAATDEAMPSGGPGKYLPGFAGRADTNKDGTVSNMEYMQAIDPNDPMSLDYVYDSLEWSHCDTAFYEKDSEYFQKSALERQAEGQGTASAAAGLSLKVEMHPKGEGSGHVGESSSPSYEALSSAKKAEYDMLKRLYDSTKGATNWPGYMKLGWLESYDVCNDWTGIICDEYEGEKRVVLINLSTNVSMSWDKQHDDYGLVGSLPDNTFEAFPRLKVLKIGYNYALKGSIPSSIKNLEYLTYIGIGHTWMSQSNVLDVLPVSAETIKMSFGGFYGSFGDITRLVKAKTLNMKGNTKLEGTVDSSLCGSIKTKFTGTRVVDMCEQCYGMTSCHEVAKNRCQRGSGSESGTVCGGYSGLYCTYDDTASTCVDSGVSDLTDCSTIDSTSSDTCSDIWHCKLDSATNICYNEGGPFSWDKR